jgi:Caudovirus prohead serine protease
MTKEFRIRSGVEVREVGGSKGKQFLVRALPYDVVDDYRTRFRMGVFDAGLAADPPTVLYGHVWTDMAQVLGRVADHTSTRQALDEVIELDDFDAVPAARQASAQLSSGTLRKFSVGFVRTADEPAPDKELRAQGVVDITEGEQEELSIVIRGAVPGAELLAARARHDPAAVAALTPTFVADLAELLRRGEIPEGRVRQIVEDAYGRDGDAVMGQVLRTAEVHELRAGITVDLLADVADRVQKGAITREQGRLMLELADGGPAPATTTETPPAEPAPATDPPPDPDPAPVVTDVSGELAAAAAALPTSRARPRP